jgi:hypothetical protein
MPGEAPRDQLASIAAVADDLDVILDKLFANVAELKVTLARARIGSQDKAADQDE